jgi:hypothetical protein
MLPVLGINNNIRHCELAQIEGSIQSFEIKERTYWKAQTFDETKQKRWPEATL